MFNIISIKNLNKKSFLNSKFFFRSKENKIFFFYKNINFYKKKQLLFNIRKWNTFFHDIFFVKKPPRGKFFFFKRLY